MANRKTVILDTDIGGDIDDTWALGMLLNCPELDLKLTVSATGDTAHRARIIAKFLDRNGRSDIDVGIGMKNNYGHCGTQREWIEDYPLGKYPGKIHEDGVQAMIDVIEKSPETVYIIAIGPLSNLAELVRRKPNLASKVHLVAMMGSIEKNHNGKPGAIAEFNVVQDIKAAQTVFAASWHEVTITPLDTCGVVILDGQLYQKVFKSEKNPARDIIENYKIWSKNVGNTSAGEKSSILYDTVAVFLAYSTDFLEMRRMKLSVDDRGFTVPDKSGQDVNVAISWHDLDAYKDHLVHRLTGI